MVRLRRLELPRISPQRPQRCASTNSAITAKFRCIINNFFFKMQEVFLFFLYFQKNFIKSIKKRKNQTAFPLFFKTYLPQGSNNSETEIRPKKYWFVQTF